jgi:hypothetical protein
MLSQRVGKGQALKVDFTLHLRNEAEMTSRCWLELCLGEKKKTK